MFESGSSFCTCKQLQLELPKKKKRYINLDKESLKRIQGVYGELNKINLVIGNILENALKYSHNGKSIFVEGGIVEDESDIRDLYKLQSEVQEEQAENLNYGLTSIFRTTVYQQNDIPTKYLRQSIYVN